MARGKKKKFLTPEERLQATLVPESEQPYKVPKNWICFRFTSLIDIEGGTQPPKSQFINEYREEYIRLVQIRDFASDKYIVFVPDTAKLKHFNEDDILIARYGASLGRICTGMSGAYNVALAKTIFSSNILNRKYVYWMLQSESFQAPLMGISRTAQAGFNKEDLSTFAMPLPPLSEQQRIVNRIESLFAKLDEAKQKAQDALDSFETRKAAILHKAFTGELTAQWRKEHGVGMESWKWNSLKSCGSWYGGGTPSMGRSEYWENGTLLWVTSKDMKSDLIEDTLMHTNMLGVENSSANYIEEPAVLFVMRSGILRRTFPVCMVKKPFTVNQDLKVLVPNAGINLEYLFWVCKANERQILDKCMKSGTTVESINTTALFAFEIPIAGKNEQTEIVRILDDLLAKEQQAKEAAEKVLDQIDLIKKAILARAFRGELGTNDPSEESAVELVKRALSN